MAEVVTLVTGQIPPGRTEELAKAYQALVQDGLPPTLDETFLLRADSGQMAILSVWRRRADLDAMLATGDEPPARRLIREAGGTPEATFYGIVHRATNRSDA